MREVRSPDWTVPHQSHQGLVQYTSQHHYSSPPTAWEEGMNSVLEGFRAPRVSERGLTGLFELCCSKRPVNLVAPPTLYVGGVINSSMRGRVPRAPYRVF
jgi:hypothetical protein